MQLELMQSTERAKRIARRRAAAMLFSRRRASVSGIAARHAVEVVASEVSRRVVLQRDFANIIGVDPGVGAVEVLIEDDGTLHFFTSDVDGGAP